MSIGNPWVTTIKATRVGVRFIVKIYLGRYRAISAGIFVQVYCTTATIFEQSTSNAKKQRQVHLPRGTTLNKL